MKTFATIDAIANLYKENHHWLYNWLRKTLRSKDRAEDVLHDTFVKIMLIKDKLIMQQPQNYLYSTAKRIIIDQARRQKIEAAYLDYIAQFADDHHVPSPEHVILAIETLDHMAAILEALDERARQILLMHYVDGIAQNLIAQQLNISTKTVHRDLIKGLMHCQRYDVF